MQQSCNWNLGKIDFSVDLETTGKDTQLTICDCLCFENTIKSNSNISNNLRLLIKAVSK